MLNQSYIPNISKIKAGDKKEFEEVFLAYYPSMLRFLRSYILVPEDRENIAQDAFLILWERCAELVADSNIQAYLFTIVRNKALNFLEKSKFHTKLHQTIKTTSEREILFKINTLSAFNPDEIFSKELYELVDKALAELPEQTRKIFELSRYEGMKNREIAALMGLTEKSIEFHNSKALKHLRERLSDYLHVLIFLINI